MARGDSVRVLECMKTLSRGRRSISSVQLKRRGVYRCCTAVFESEMSVVVPELALSIQDKV